ncbi:stress response protein NST1 [Scheffersomyces xylosifermentans]|uniref:stress response protein NST1 n=1 Tax=Scheffersomyces xylosifermentans TaxID=1304137 RepID=UPI00315C912A
MSIPEPSVDSRFRLGEDIHFDYGQKNIGDDAITSPMPSNSTPTPAVSSSKKKKKKKSKPKSKPSPSSLHATLNNPDDDYPTSRVIKQAPNGDVIVESLDDEYSEESHDIKHHHHSTNIWDSASIEEQENLKSFWESLDEPSKMELVKIDKKSIMEIFKNETRANNQSFHNHSNGNSNNQQSHNNTNVHSNTNINSNPSNCACKYCGRRSTIIEDELENIYDNRFDDIIDFIHEIRDIKDLNALPGLLFGGFHMLEEEHKLQKRQHKLKRNVPAEERIEEIHNVQSNVNNEVNDEKDLEKVHTLENGLTVEENSSTSREPRIEEVHEEKHIEDTVSEQPLQHETTILEEQEVQDVVNAADVDSNFTNEQKIFHKLLDPKLFEALENLDFEKLKDATNDFNNNNGTNDGNNNVANLNQANLLQKAGSLREIIRDLHKADKAQLEKGLSFLKNISKIFAAPQTGAAVAANGSVEGVSQQQITSKFNDQLTQGLSSFAEDLLKNDGNSFIEMMESLSESRTVREDLLKENIHKKEHAAWVDEDDGVPEKEKSIIPEQKGSNGALSNVAHEDIDYDDYEDGDEDDEEEDEGDDYDDDEDLEEEEDDLDGEDSASDTESEISEEEKMQEIRRLFLIQVIKLFQERLKNAYKEKLSQDRTQRLIEELEAEENAKKERELKKLKQKEKAKEKKRLQQVAKEEERKRKEEEQKAKEEELKQKQEALKADQKRRKEEAKLRRDEEKKKRIEDLKRKEEEHRKKVEAQQKKEEEAKKLKEERRKKVEEERRKKEEEKKQKELLRKQKEEERERLKLEREQEEAEEYESKLEKQQTLENTISLPYNEDINGSSNVPVITSTSPTKNHLLEQLYQAKPTSFSGSSVPLPSVTAAPIQFNPEPSIPTPPIPSVVSLSPVLPGSILNNSVSPNTGNSLLYTSSNPPTLAGTINNVPNAMSPWTSKSRLNSTSMPSAQAIFQPQIPAAGFSPFSNDFTTKENLINVNNPLGSTNGELGAPSGTAPGVWNQPATSRNNSIWSSQPNPANASIWGSSLPSMAAQPGLQTSNPNALQTTSVIDNDLIQAATYNAFQMLQGSNQLEFGVAPFIKLFQTTKNVLGNNSLTINQFLGACNTSTMYSFELIYDDFGTVTHVKVGSPNNVGIPPSMQLPPNQSLLSHNIGTGIATGLRTSPPPGFGGPSVSTGLSNLNQFGSSSILSSLGEWTGNSNVASGTAPDATATTNFNNGNVRGLWN